MIIKKQKHLNSESINLSLEKPSIGLRLPTLNLAVIIAQ